MIAAVRHTAPIRYSFTQFKDTTNESASVACSNIDGCESWTLRKNEETRLEAFEMKGLIKILRVSWTAKKTNEWVLNIAGVKRVK